MWVLVLCLGLKVLKPYDVLNDMVGAISPWSNSKGA